MVTPTTITPFRLVFSILNSKTSCIVCKRSLLTCVCTCCQPCSTEQIIDRCDCWWETQQQSRWRNENAIDSQWIEWNTHYVNSLRSFLWNSATGVSKVFKIILLACSSRWHILDRIRIYACIYTNSSLIPIWGTHALARTTSRLHSKLLNVSYSPRVRA